MPDADRFTVDMVVADADRAAAIMVVVVSQEWSPAVEQAVDTKLGQYARWCLSGQFAQHYPDMAGLPVRIEVNCQAGLPADVAVYADRRRSVLAEHGLGFAVVTFERRPTGETVKHSY